MQCYGVVADNRTHAAPNLHIWKRHVSGGIICASSLLHAWRVPRPKGTHVGAIHIMPRMRGFWHDAMVCCSHLQLAVPTGRSPFAALPLDPFPP